MPTLDSPVMKLIVKPAVFACGLLALGFAAQADDIVMPTDGTVQQGAMPKPADIPSKGQSMAQVVKRFGEPQNKHAPAGGDTPKHPPITRWDYAGFSVFFSHSHVIDTVVPGSPPQLYNTEQLKPAT
jgi:hypothetical protein